MCPKWSICVPNGRYVSQMHLVSIYPHFNTTYSNFTMHRNSRYKHEICLNPCEIKSNNVTDKCAGYEIIRILCSDSLHRSTAHTYAFMTHLRLNIVHYCNCLNIKNGPYGQYNPNILQKPKINLSYIYICYKNVSYHVSCNDCCFA